MTNSQTQVEQAFMLTRRRYAFIGVDADWIDDVSVSERDTLSHRG